MEIVHSIMSYGTTVIDSSHLLEESMATRNERHTCQSDVINMTSEERIYTGFSPRSESDSRDSTPVDHRKKH